MPRSDASSGTRPAPPGGHQIRGNATDEIKDLASSIFFHFIDAKGRSFGSDVGKNVKITEINIRGLDPSVRPNSQATNVVEIGGGDVPSVETVFQTIISRGELRKLTTFWFWLLIYFLTFASAGP